MRRKTDPNQTSFRTPTIQDVARLAGVSTATVSRVLAKNPVVSEKTRERVMDAIQELNYLINRNASNLRRSKFSKIGVVITDIQNPFFSTVVRGIEKVTIAEDYTLILGNSDEDPAREAKLLRMFLEEGVAGIIFVPTNADCSAYSDLLKANTPLVIVDRSIEPCEADSVNVDGYAGSVAAIEYLIGLGHRQIGFIGGLAHLSVMQDRERGYLDTLRKHGQPFPPRFLSRGNNRQDGGYQAMRQLLALSQIPSAVLVANNLMTLGGLEAIHQAGIKIPQQISLIGFDDMDWAPSLQPPLSVVAQPAYEMGERAAALLLERLHEPDLPPRKVLLKTELILRSSCQKVP